MSVHFKPKSFCCGLCCRSFLNSMVSCKLLKGPEQVCDSKGGTGVPRERRTLLFSFAPLLAVESHWKVLSLLWLVMLEFEPAEGFAPVWCDWGEKAALPGELGWINSQNSGPGELLYMWAGIASMCRTSICMCECSPGGSPVRKNVFMEVRPWCV